MNNVFIEALWRSMKYEEIYLRKHATMPELVVELNRRFQRYTELRPHQALGNRTPSQVHEGF